MSLTLTKINKLELNGSLVPQYKIWTIIVNALAQDTLWAKRSLLLRFFMF